MWFRPPERNTLRLRENGVVLLKPFRPTALTDLFFLTLVKRCLPNPFIAQGRVVIMRPGVVEILYNI
jgi:hypothetical protein